MSNEKKTATDTPVDALSQYGVGEVLNMSGAELDYGKTTPPPHYTQAALINDMLNAGKFVKDADSRAILRKSEGIGTARTRASTLSALLGRKLLIPKERSKKQEIISSALARQTIGNLPPWLTDVATTAKWEEMFEAIEKGALAPQVVIDSQKRSIEIIVDRAKALIPSDK